MVGQPWPGHYVISLPKYSLSSPASHHISYWQFISNKFILNLLPPLDTTRLQTRISQEFSISQMLEDNDQIPSSATWSLELGVIFLSVWNINLIKLWAVGLPSLNEGRKIPIPLRLAIFNWQNIKTKYFQQNNSHGEISFSVNKDVFDYKKWKERKSVYCFFANILFLTYKLDDILMSTINVTINE